MKSKPYAPHCALKTGWRSPNGKKRRLKVEASRFGAAQIAPRTNGVQREGMGPWSTGIADAGGILRAVAQR